jgi:hypothetical protein
MAFLSGRTSLTTVQAGDIATDAITTAKIAASAVTTAKIAAGAVETSDIAANAIDSTLTKDALIADYTEVTIATGDSLLLGDVNDSGNTKRDTVQGLLDLVSAGGFTEATQQATTSGSAITFGSIPAGTTIIIISLDNVSSSGTVFYDVTIGDAGGLETSGYNGNGMEVNDTNQRSFANSSAFRVATTDHDNCNLHGTITLTLQDSATFHWSCTCSIGEDSTNDGAYYSGSGKDLTAELTQLSFITTGTFDLGAVNIMYQ